MLSKTQIKKIKTLQRQIPWLARDRESYLGLIASAVGRRVESCTELSMAEAGKVIDALNALLEQTPGRDIPRRRSAATPFIKGEYPAVSVPRPSGSGGYPGRPANMDDQDRGKLLKKIEALLAEAGRPWAYADGIARKMFRVDKIAWCRAGDLHKIVAALMIDQRRRKARRQASDARCQEKQADT